MENQSTRSQPLCYQRLVLNNLNEDDNCIENIQIDVDLIEINSRMVIYGYHKQYVDLAERYNILAFGLFYCGMCPISILIVMCFFYLDNLFSILSRCYVLQRKLTDPQKVLGSWGKFADGIMLVTIITNGLLLFVSDSSYNNVLKTLGETTGD